MSFQIKPTPDFQRRAKRLVKKYISLKIELEKLVEQLRDNPTLGISLGANAYKIRKAKVAAKVAEFVSFLSLFF